MSISRKFYVIYLTLPPYVVGRFQDTTLLQDEHLLKLDEWVGRGKEWKLIYKATRDGFEGKDFHKACDGKGENLGVIRSENGYLFGWWTPLSWQSIGDYASDASTFLFMLTNPARVPAKYKVKDAEYALLFNSSCGPFFGFFDLWCNGKGGLTQFPQYYEDTTGRGNETFTGNQVFKVSEMEVFVPL